MTATRITSIGVMHGITIAGLLLVSDPGNPDNVVAPFRHSAWNGISLADLVFPFFLFVVGVTTQLSFTWTVSSCGRPAGHRGRAGVALHAPPSTTVRRY